MFHGTKIQINLHISKKNSNFVPKMDKKHLIHSIEWLIAVAACGWLIWKMASYDDYDSLWASLREMAAPQWTALLLALLLMPLNMAVEAWK